jgi:hypothetical protein
MSLSLLDPSLLALRYKQIVELMKRKKAAAAGK